MGFSRQEYWSGLPFPGDLPNPGIEPWSPALCVDALPSEPPGKPLPFSLSFIYFLLAVLGFAVVCGLSLTVASRGYCLVVLCELLIAVACLAMHGF